jgi:hypothetical protein
LISVGRDWVDGRCCAVVQGERDKPWLTFAMTGPVGSLLARLGAGKIRSMVDTEATSLKDFDASGAALAGR